VWLDIYFTRKYEGVRLHISLCFATMDRAVPGWAERFLRNRLSGLQVYLDPLMQRYRESATDTEAQAGIWVTWPRMMVAS